MKIDFSQKIIGPDGKAYDQNLGDICAAALNEVKHLREPLKLDEAIKRGNLALKAVKGGEHEIEPEDAALIRSLLPIVCPPVVVAIVAGMVK